MGAMTTRILQQVDDDETGCKMLLRDKIEMLRRDPKKQQLYKMLLNTATTDNGGTDRDASPQNSDPLPPHVETKADADHVQNRMKSMTPKEKFLKDYRNRSGSLTQPASTTSAQNEFRKDRCYSDAMIYRPPRLVRGQRLVSVSDCIDNIINSQITRRNSTTATSSSTASSDPLQMISAQVRSIASGREQTPLRHDISNWAMQTPVGFRGRNTMASSTAQNGRPATVAASVKTHAEPCQPPALPVPRHYGPSFVTGGTPVYSASNICPQMGPAQQSYTLHHSSSGLANQRMPRDAAQQRGVCFPGRSPGGSMSWPSAAAGLHPQTNHTPEAPVSPVINPSGVHLVQGMTPGGTTCNSAMRMVPGSVPTAVNSSLSPGASTGIRMPYAAPSSIAYSKASQSYFPGTTTKQVSDNDHYAAKMLPPLIRMTLAPPAMGTQNRPIVLTSKVESVTPITRRPYEKPLDLSEPLECLSNSYYPIASRANDEAPLDLSKHMSKIDSVPPNHDGFRAAILATKVHMSNVNGERTMPIADNYQLPSQVNGHIAGMVHMQHSIEQRERPDPIPYHHQQQQQPAWPHVVPHKTSTEVRPSIILPSSRDDNLYITCNVCNVTYGSEHSIKGHFLKMHGCEPEPHLISIQSFSDIRSREMAAVVKNSAALSSVEEKKSMLKCDRCGAEFPTRDWGVFRRHVRGHDVPPDATFKCTVCSACFCNSDARRQHMTHAHNITSCLCRTCDIGFTHIGALSLHLRNAHRDSESVDVEYRCLYCPKMFVQQQQLFDHTRRHESLDGVDVSRADKAVSVRPISTTPPHEAPDTTCESKDVKDTNDVVDRNKASTVDEKKLQSPFAVKIQEPRFNMEMFNRNMNNAKVCVPHVSERKSPSFTKTTIKVKLPEKTSSDALVEKPLLFDSGKIISQKVEEVADIELEKDRLVIDESGLEDDDDDRDVSVHRKRKMDTVGSLMTDKRARATSIPQKPSVPLTARSLIDDIVESAVAKFNRTHTPEDETVPQESSDERVKTFMAEMLRSFPTLRSKPDNVRDIIASLVTAELPNEEQSASTDKTSRASSEVNISAEKKTDKESVVKPDGVPPVSTPAVVKPVKEMTPPVFKETPMLTDYEPQLSSTTSHKCTKRTYGESMPAMNKVKKYGSVRYPAMFADFHPMQCLASDRDDEAVKQKKTPPTVLHKLYPTVSSSKPTASASTAKDSDAFSSLFAEFHPTLCSDHACDGEDGHNHADHKPGHGHDHAKGGHDHAKGGHSHAHEHPHDQSHDHPHDQSHDHHPHDHHHHDHDDECLSDKQLTRSVSSRRYHQCAAASGSADKMAIDASPRRPDDIKLQTPSSP